MFKQMKWQHWVLPMAIAASVLVVLLPLPAGVLDLLLIGNLAVSLIILLTTLSVKTPLEFSVFPSLLLATTLGRLVLNIATTRRILTSGSEGLDSAGGVIQGFGQFVTGDSIVVGIIIFAIVVLIQFIVVTAGSSRISEVAARFALDSLPGRQMAIDAELNAGSIDNQQAAEMRDELLAQSDFLGAMDGASKFVRGDAIAGIAITAVNICGGLLIGLLHGMDLAEAVAVFTKLTIGDGLASQLPSFLIAISAGLLVSRSRRESDLSLDMVGQLFMRPQVLAIVGGFVLLLVVTRLPLLPSLMIGALCVAGSLNLNRREKKRVARAEQESVEPIPEPAPTVRIEDYLAVDPLEVEVGIDLVPLADPTVGGDLLDRVNRIRQSIAVELGIILPKVRIKDNLNLEPDRYRIRVFNNPMGDGELQPGRLLAVEQAAGGLSRMGGQATFDPATGQSARWIDPENERRARELGCQVLTPAAVLAKHLASLTRQHADLILTRDATVHLLNEVKKTSPAVVDELVPEIYRVADIQRVLQLLLQEGVSIRQLGIILETLGNHVECKSNPIQLVETVRRRLAGNLCARYSDDNSVIHAVTFNQNLTLHLSEKSSWQDSPAISTIPAAEQEALVEQIAVAYEPWVERGVLPVLLVAPEIRPVIREILDGRLPGVVVLSTSEITNDFNVKILDEVAVPRELLEQAG